MSDHKEYEVIMAGENVGVWNAKEEARAYSRELLA